ncbi:MAG: histidinol-phosphate transaminase [Betaproteobacteria bacterium]|nr:histidinol-phosphate transaminase [Betaproteobacteria bacterium]
MAQKPEDIIRDEVRALTGYHVPDSAGMVKLDAMENPYRLPQDVRGQIAALVAHAEINRYPDAAATRLKTVLRATLNIPADTTVLLGNGSDEIIQMLMLATARPGAVVLGVEPSFVMFRLVATFCGMRYVGVPLQPDFSMDADAMIAAIEEHRPALVFIAYPNNPTGNLFEAVQIDRVLQAAPGMVVVDEAYHAFAGRTYMNRFGDYPNLLVMRTLSKSGLAGLRLGLLAGHSEWLRHVDKVRLPYNVSVLTQLVAEQVLQHQVLLDDQAATIKSERTRLHKELKRTPGIMPFPSDANFILFRTAAAERIFDGLKHRGILVKNLHGAHSALAGCLRVTVGTAEENDTFLDALRASLA